MRLISRAIALVLLVSLRGSSVSAGGIALAWDDCNAAGSLNRNFACDTNSGTNVLVASYASPILLTRFSALEAVVETVSPAGAFPDWWKMQSTGCRANAASVSADFSAGPFTCADWWGTRQTVGGGLNYAYPYSGPGFPPGTGVDSLHWARCRVAFAVPDEQAGVIEPDREYYAFKLRFSNAKTLGGTACGGCTAPMCMVLSSIRLYQLFGAPGENVELRAALPWGSTRVTWQGDAIPGSCVIVPARRTTWGQVKSLYR
jgi:hypothetical protein